MNATRSVLALSFALFAAGCDSADTDGLCLPQDGCDGITELAEIAPPELQPEALDFDANLRPDWCEEGEGISYAAEDPETCSTILILCEPGWQYFGNECGCGCIYVGDVAPSELQRTNDFASNPP